MAKNFSMSEKMVQTILGLLGAMHCRANFTMAGQHAKNVRAPDEELLPGIACLANAILYRLTALPKKYSV